MAMAEVLDRPAAAAANPFLGSYPDRPPRARRTAGPVRRARCWTC